MKAALKTQRVSVVERASVRGPSGSLFSVFLRGCHRFTRFSLSRSHALGGGGRMALLLIPSAASSIIFISSYMITKTHSLPRTRPGHALTEPRCCDCAWKSISWPTKCDHIYQPGRLMKNLVFLVALCAAGGQQCCATIHRCVVWKTRTAKKSDSHESFSH